LFIHDTNKYTFDLIRLYLYVSKVH